MSNHEFIIVATGLSVNTDEWEEAFYEAGCDDATVSLQRGAFILSFDRDAATFEEAVRSGCNDVKSAGGSILRIEPDPLVSSSDIADRAGITRQAVSLYTNGGRGENFPLPIACASGPRPLWSWGEVASWLAAKGKLSTNAVEQAVFIKFMNDKLSAGDGEKGSNSNNLANAEARSYTCYEDYVTDGAPNFKRSPARPSFRGRRSSKKQFELRPKQVA
eukprot:TRINITY_DN11341_c0_g1_i1.p1 TRINITY_DN11341_c0_g1~~TRINITY_DN11341_c0_g1_i1.p1  ORF type:complete len:218 (-),score=7.22 TRINITY_DN11341_c0_g1_i1:11-664(-)